MEEEDLPTQDSESSKSEEEQEPQIEKESNVSPKCAHIDATVATPDNNLSLTPLQAAEEYIKSHLK